MIYPTVAYGDPVLKKVAQEIPEGTNIEKLVADMYETMENAKGIGLAAPQIDKSIRLFIIDTSHAEEEESRQLRKVFVNAEIIEESGDEWVFEEGCLSIPDVHADVSRPEKVLIKYFDQEWNLHKEEFDGMNARVIQHEYDHIEGILFTDYVTGLKKRLLKKKLINISKGKITPRYRMKFPKI